VIGKKVNMLMPEPHSSHHDQYIQSYVRTGRKKVIGIGRETMAQRKDGSTFPIKLAVSEVKLGHCRHPRRYTIDKGKSLSGGFGNFSNFAGTGNLRNWNISIPITTIDSQQPGSILKTTAAPPFCLDKTRISFISDDSNHWI
jgi:hypothetical protein